MATTSMTFLLCLPDTVSLSANWEKNYIVADVVTEVLATELDGATEKIEELAGENVSLYCRTPR